jgi:hypothetical protein
MPAGDGERPLGAAIARDVRWSATTLGGDRPSPEDIGTRVFWEARVLGTVITIFICIIITVGFVFYCFRKVGAQHVKLKAGWKSVELEIDRPDDPP